MNASNWRIKRIVLEEQYDVLVKAKKNNHTGRIPNEQISELVENEI